MKRFSVVLVLLLGWVPLFSAHGLVEASEPIRLLQSDYPIDGPDPGIRLNLREKIPVGMTPALDPKDRVVLFVHGATFSGVSGFDLPYPGYSWMAYLAQRGYYTYALDIRGYGGSTRPPEMDAPPRENRPVARAEVARRDIGAAVDHLRAKHKIEKINLVGWSWGTVTTGWYTSLDNEKVRRLVLFAPVYGVAHPIAKRFEDPTKPGEPNWGIGAYRFVDPADTTRWDQQIPVVDKSLWRDPAVLAAWQRAVLDSDPTAGTRTPPSIRAPNGALIDIYYIFSNRPLYDASRIAVPTLVIRGEHDTESTEADALGLFKGLTGTPRKRYIVIGNGTHVVNLERNRLDLYREVYNFLDE